MLYYYNIKKINYIDTVKNIIFKKKISSSFIINHLLGSEMWEMHTSNNNDNIIITIH